MRRYAAAGAVSAHGLASGGDVAHGSLLFDRRRAARVAAQPWPDQHPLEIGACDRPQVDLALQTTEVPPIAARPRGQGAGTGSIIDAHGQPVYARSQTSQVNLPGQVPTGMAADLAPVEPNGGVVDDRLEPDNPTARRHSYVARKRGRRQREVPAIPADIAVIALAREVPDVVGVGHRDRRPSVGG